METSRNFNDWIQFNEIGPKTAALLFHAAFGVTAALPVDSHVYHAFQQWQWTNAKSEDECAWQASQWMEKKYLVTTNDAIRSIRQCLADKKTKHKILRHANQLPSHIKELILLLK